MKSLRCQSSSAIIAGALLFLATLPSAADSSLLGICSEVANNSCSVSTSWGLQESSSPAQLNNPSGATAGFQIVATEGATTSVLNLQDMLTLDGLIESGTNISAIYVSLQKGDSSGNYTTVASAAVGDTSTPCGCPFVQSTMTLSALDPTGAALQGSPLVALAYGAQESISLALSWNLAQGLIQPGDTLRVQPCVTYVPAAISLPPGCFTDGGGVRATRACTPFSLDSCAPVATPLSELLTGLTSPIATLSGFTASSSSASVSPPSVSQLPGGSAVTFNLTPTGVPGTQSVIDVQGQVSCNTVGTASFSDSSTLSGESASASIGLLCLGTGWGCDTLGAAAPYNLFVTQGVVATDSDVEGALAAGGDVTLTSYEIGADLDAGTTALVAGGDLDLTQGWIEGNAWVAGTPTFNSAGLSGVLHAGTTLDFTGTGNTLQSLSTQLAALAPSGTAQLQSNGSLLLSGTDPTLDVFELSSSTLSSGWALTLQVPSTAFVIVNVTGTSAQFVNQGFNPGATPAQQLLFNFPSATTLQLSSIGLAGTLLAPAAAVTFNNGAIQGALLAKSFSGDGQLDLAPALQCIPIPPAP